MWTTVVVVVVVLVTKPCKPLKQLLKCLCVCVCLLQSEDEESEVKKIHHSHCVLLTLLCTLVLPMTSTYMSGHSNLLPIYRHITDFTTDRLCAKYCEDKHCGTLVYHLSGIINNSLDLLTYLSTNSPRAGSGVVRIDPLHFLAGCCKRRLNQAVWPVS